MIVQSIAKAIAMPGSNRSSGGLTFSRTRASDTEELRLAAFLGGAADEVRDVAAAVDADSAARLDRIAAVLDAFAGFRMSESIDEDLLSRQTALIEELGELASSWAPPLLPPATHESSGAVIAQLLRQLAGEWGDESVCESPIAPFHRSSSLDKEVWALLTPQGPSEERKARSGESRSSAAVPAPDPSTLARYLSGAVNNGGLVEVRDVRPLKGINSKDIVFFEQVGIDAWPAHVVMRRMRQFQVNEHASVEYEGRLLRDLRAAGIAVPRTLLVESRSEPLDQPFLLAERMPGKARATDREAVSSPGAIASMARHLATIHSVDLESVRVRDPWPGLAASDRLSRWLNDYETLWRGVELTPLPLLEHAFVWLRTNVSRVDESLVLVHGDFDLRNILVEDDEIVAVLDWERSHVGHPAEDLAYAYHDVVPSMPFEEFVNLYERETGTRVDPDSLAFFRVWMAMVRVLGSSHIHDAYVRGSHDDFALGAAGILERPVFARRLADELERII